MEFKSYLYGALASHYSQDLWIVSRLFKYYFQLRVQLSVLPIPSATAGKNNPAQLSHTGDQHLTAVTEISLNSLVKISFF